MAYARRRHTLLKGGRRHTKVKRSVSVKSGIRKRPTWRRWNLNWLFGRNRSFRRG